MVLCLLVKSIVQKGIQIALDNYVLLNISPKSICCDITMDLF
jgi:hypothetical protein